MCGWLVWSSWLVSSRQVQWIGGYDVVNEVSKPGGIDESSGMVETQ